MEKKVDSHLEFGATSLKSMDDKSLKIHDQSLLDSFSVQNKLQSASEPLNHEYSAIKSCQDPLPRENLAGTNSYGGKYEFFARIFISPC